MVVEIKCVLCILKRTDRWPATTSLNLSLLFWGSAAVSRGAEKWYMESDRDRVMHNNSTRKGYLNVRFSASHALTHSSEYLWDRCSHYLLFMRQLRLREGKILAQISGRARVWHLHRATRLCHYCFKWLIGGEMKNFWDELLRICW